MVTDPTSVLDALGAPTRRAILARLRAGPLAVGEIADGLPVSRPAVSKHLRVLEDAGLVDVERHGTRREYQLARRGFDAARAYLDGFWGEALTRFARVVDEEAGP